MTMGDTTVLEQGTAQCVSRETRDTTGDMEQQRSGTAERMLSPVPPLIWTEHPLIDLVEGGRYRKLSDAEFAEMASALGEDVALAYYRGREERIRKAETDPLNFGFELPHWPDVRTVIKQKLMTGILGGNNSAKSFFFGKLCCEALTGKFTWPEMYPGNVRVLMVAQDDGASLQYQQTAVYAHLPASARAYNVSSGKRRGAVTKINYSQANGFTEGTFVLPNKAQCWFKTVAQYTRDPNSFEGPSYHLILIDEGCPLPLLELLRVRAAKVGGKVVYGHTCVHGIDATSGNLLAGAKVVKSLPMNYEFATGTVDPEMEFPELKLSEVQVRGCPAGHMPFIMQPLDFDRGLIFTWCHWNPFQPRGTWLAEKNSDAVARRVAPEAGAVPKKMGKYPMIFDTCKGQPKWKVRVKLFGWIEKLAGAKIGNFDPNVHVIPHAIIEEKLKAGKLTTYQSADPHIARSYFMVWKGVDADGQEYIFDECPNMEEGEWVDANGDPGEGSRVYGSVGVNFIKRMIREREREHGVEALRRFGDPRAFATQAAAAQGGTSLFELFREDHVDSAREARAEAPEGGRAPQEYDWKNPAHDLAPMFFEPAKIRQTVDLDLERIVSALAFDRAKFEQDGKLTVENQPRLYISDRCQNFIRALMNFDGGADSPFKDPVDAGARYLFCEETPFVDPNVSNVKAGAGWG
jgi:hypothetical protein